MTCIFRTVSTTFCGLFLSALSVVAQDALSQDTGTGSAGAVQLLVENHAAASVELSQYGPDGALADSDVLEELEQGELEVPAGTRLEASLHDPDTPATERQVFMTYTVSETPAAQVMKIPDPLLLQPVGLTFRNGGPSPGGALAAGRQCRERGRSGRRV